MNDQDLAAQDAPQYQHDEDEDDIDDVDEGTEPVRNNMNYNYHTTQPRETEPRMTGGTGVD